MLQGKRDVETVLTMGIMEDVSIIAQPAGDPAGARLKPGNGPGSGFGIRVDSPLGPFRLEYAFNDKKHKRFYFGVGHKTKHHLRVCLRVEF
ncbi:PREDICTED: outer envelope protein 80, chloroplastic-like isoform X2 [Lupinus angustifolius]|uniref:outer envelope protein 80, chloroplastic-like isoform X2 n=1 Tax=Lupinus angustifolius TaxID=3871 RepID=UPI00092FB7CA|nr:PREDICTED: outer envelope protein 80, chloroplastic-like isoform X2 [Lupinus angustifolius]